MTSHSIENPIGILNLSQEDFFSNFYWFSIEQIKQYFSFHQLNINTPSKKGNTLLFLACLDNQTLPLLPELIELGADPNLQNDYGLTPLMILVRGKRTQEALYLLECGANINLPDNNGYTPLVYALYENHSMISILLEYHSSLKIKTTTGLSIKDIALEQGIDIESLQKSIQDNKIIQKDFQQKKFQNTFAQHKVI